MGYLRISHFFFLFTVFVFSFARPVISTTYYSVAFDSSRVTLAPRLRGDHSLTSTKDNSVHCLNTNTICKIHAFAFHYFNCFNCSLSSPASVLLHSSEPCTGPTCTARSPAQLVQVQPAQLGALLQSGRGQVNVLPTHSLTSTFAKCRYDKWPRFPTWTLSRYPPNLL